MFFSKYYISISSFLSLFFLFKLLFIISILILILANRNFLFFLGWDGLGISSYFLVVFFINWKRRNAGFLTILRNRVGDSFILILICFWIIFFKDNIFSNFLFLNYFLVILIIFLAFTKRAQFPFSSWLPAAIAAPTPISALVHSSTLVTAGIYVVFQLFNFLQIKFILLFLFCISFLTIFHSGFFSLRERDIKKIIALSTLNQLAIIFLTLSLSLKILGFAHLNTHAIFKSLLFVNAGVIIHHHFNLQDSRKQIRIYFFSKLCSLRIFLRIFRLIGIFFSSGFFSKDFIFEKIIEREFSFFLSFSFLLILSFTFFYSFRFIISFSSSFKILSLFFSLFRIIFFIPIFFLSLGRIFLGKIIFNNFFNIFIIRRIFSLRKIFLFISFSIILFLFFSLNFNKNYLNLYFRRIFYLRIFTFFFSKLKKFFNFIFKIIIEKRFLEIISFNNLFFLWNKIRRFSFLINFNIFFLIFCFNFFIFIIL